MALQKPNNRRIPSKDEEDEKKRQTGLMLPTFEELVAIEEKAKEDAARVASSERRLDLFKTPDVWDSDASTGEKIANAGKIALGTLGDVGVGAVKGVMKMGEGIGDALQYGAAAVTDLFGADETAERIRKNAQREAVADAFRGVDEKLDRYSVLGRTADAGAEALGQIGAIVGTAGVAGALHAGAVGTTAATTGLMGLSSFGSGTGEAYAAGADEGEAEAYGAIAGAADALSEMIFGGLGKGFKALGLSKGITSADDLLAKAVTSKIRNTLAKNAVQLGIKAGAEGLEEVLAGTMQAAGKKATYMSERDFADIIKDENLLEQFVVGAMASGISQTPSFFSATRAGVDLVSDGADAASDSAQGAQDKFAALRDKNADFGEIERTGLASGAKDEDIRMAGELSSVLGKKIRFFWEDSKNGTINNGEYHEDTGEIWINTRSKNVKAQIVAHELTHSIEKNDGYRQLVDLTMNKLEEEQKAKGKTLDDLYREKETLYADGGVRLASYDEITSELVAEFVERRLLTDEASIKSLVSENRTLGQRIREWFDSLLAKMGNASAKEREYIRQMRDVYARALGENIENNGSGVRHSLVGENANIDKSQLAVAKQMEADGKTSEEIYAETGWYKQSDGKWRTEIPDEIMIPENFSRTGLRSAKDAEADRYLARIKADLEDGLISEEVYTELEEFAEGIRGKDIKNGKLPSFLDAPKLYEAYPQLKKVNLTFRKISAGQGYSDIGQNQIVLDPEGLNEAGYTVREGLAHEIQHFIQNIEGFASGSSPEAAGSYEAYRKSGGEIEARDVEDRLRMSEDERRRKMPVRFSVSAEDDEAVRKNTPGVKDAEETEQINREIEHVDLNYDSESGTVYHSFSSLEDAFDYNESEEEYRAARNEYAYALAKATGKTYAQAQRYLDDLFLIHDLIGDDRERLDYVAAVDRSSWVGNVEYGGSIDFSTLCAKRRLFTGTFDAIQQALPDTVLNENDFLRIRELLVEKGLESPCSMCYVEGSRAKHGVYVERFLRDYLATDPAWRPQIADFTSTTRLEQTRIQHPEAYKAYTDAMNKLSQRKPKEASVRTDYKGEILRAFKNDDNVNAKNKMGGIRFNSFSDFEIIHAIDVMQVLTDMARVGLHGQSYTKQKEFAEAFGNTGLKINLSLVAKDVDSDGRLIFDEVNGMKESEAMDIRDRYSENVGTVIVVFNEVQLRAALADERIDFVLPFHRSQWKKSQYTMMGLPAETRDFTNIQNDRMKNPKTGRAKKVDGGNIMPNQYWDPLLDGRGNAQLYLDYINENDYIPKFDFLLTKQDGKWVLPEGAVGDGYFKLLIDFKMYDNDGNGAPQRPVTPNFNMPYITKMLEDYKGGHGSFPVANDIVDTFVREKKGGRVKRSVTRIDDQRYKDAVDRGDTETAQRMVEEAARAAGYNTRKVYHGSHEKFNSFSHKTSGGLFNFAERPENAEAYALGGGGGRNQTAEQMIAVDENGTAWEYDPDADVYEAVGYWSDDLEGTKLRPIRETDKGKTLGRDYVEGNLQDGDGNGEFMMVSKNANVGSYYLRMEKTLDLVGDPKTANSVFRGIAEKVFSNEDAPVEAKQIMQRILWSRQNDYLDFWTVTKSEHATKVFEKYVVPELKKLGYDSLYHPDDSHKTYAVFDENQIKSADPVTYDDNGNVIPLSERFKRDSDDIRHSVSREDASVTEAETDQTLQQIRNDIAADEARYRELSDTVMSNERFNAMMPDEQNAILDEMQSLRERIDRANQIMQDMSYEQDMGNDVPMPTDEDVYQSTAEQGMYDDMEAEYAELIRDKRKEDAVKRTKQKAKDRRVEERLNRQYEDALTWRFGDQTQISEERLMEDAQTVESMGEREFLEEQGFGYRDMMDQMDEDAAERYKEWRETQKQERAHLREVEDDLNRQFEQAEKERRELNRRQREEDRKRRIERGEIQTVAQRLEENLRSAQLERSDIDQMRRNASEEYQMIIDDIQERYDALKNKNTAEANTLLRRISRTESRARTEDEAYQKRIYDIDEKIGRIQSEIQRKESPTEQRNMRRDLHESILYRIKERFAERGLDFDKVLAKAKDISTFATVDNTPQRVMEKSLGYKEGRELSDLTIDQAARNETEGIRWLNGFTDKKDGVLAKLSKKYNIKPGSKESAAAQMYAEGFYVSDKNEIVEYGDRELAADFPDAQVRENIKGLAHDPIIRQIYDETLDAINASRTRNAFPEIQKLDNYYLHFRAMDDTFSRLGIPFNPNDIRAKDLPTDLNGVTADLKPGQPYFASAKHRLGKRTSFDLLGGMEKYLTSAKNQIYHIDDIQTLRALRNYVADMYGQAEGLANLDDLSDEEVEARIKDVYGSHLSTFAKFLNEEANVLAGKTSLIDRGLEGVIGRRGITFLNDFNRQVGANMVGYNISSSLTNFLAPVQAFAKMNKAAFIKGFAQTVENRMKSIAGNGDDFAQKSDVIVRRKGADRFHRTVWQKMSDPGYLLMGMVDDISTEIIARAKYNELTAKGMDAETANRETDKWVSRLMGDRSLGQMPQIFNSKMLGLVTKFQLEVRNQLDSQFYDTIKEAQVQYEEIGDKAKRNAKTAAKVAATFAELALAQHVFGSVFESIAGYNPAFDIIEVIATVLGLDDDEESEDTALDNIEQGVLAMIEDLPYSSVILDGGRIPVSSAMPIGEIIKGQDEYGNDINRLKTVAEAVPYYALPGGYGQIKKTAKGLSMFSGDKAVTGSYTDSGNLRFPVEATPGNIAQAAVFGQWASENARDYFDNERKPANKRQTMGYAESGLEWKEFQRYRDQISKLDRDADKLALIRSLDIDQTAKEALYRYLVASAKKDDDGNIIGSSEDERLAALYATGLRFSDYADAKLKQAELNADEGLTANQRASRFLAWTASQGYTDAQADVIGENFGFSSGFRVKSETYQKIVDGGVDPDNAVKVSDALAGKTKTADKINAVWSTGLSGNQLDLAVKSVLSEKAYERYRIVVDANIPLEIYTWALLNADQDAEGEKGHGSVNNTERELILSQLALPRKDLSALWLALGGSEKSNPYSGISVKIEMPKIEMPKIEMPKIELPKIGG